jgi:hypothetical protein
MVVLLVKFNLAAIPSMLILGGLSGLVAAAVDGFFAGLRDLLTLFFGASIPTYCCVDTQKLD